ncbi:hypothetical protein SNEBB_007015 [Seison nebaliae]|nr:hypothetical protein SNEBB_007015 [Seison nebaliae]
MISRKTHMVNTAKKKIWEHFEKNVPKFVDVFDERTFYFSFISLVVGAIIIAIVASYCCKIKLEDIDDLPSEIRWPKYLRPGCKLQQRQFERLKKRFNKFQKSKIFKNELSEDEEPIVEKKECDISKMDESDKTKID